MKQNKKRPESGTERTYYRAFYRGNRLTFAVAMALMILSASFGLIFSQILGDILDLIAAADLGALGRIGILLLILIPAMLLVMLLTDFLRSRFIHRALEQYKSLAFRRLTEKSISAFTRENTGRYVSALTNDVSSVEENYLNRSFLLFYHCALFAGALAMMLFYDWRLTLLSVVLCALPILISVALGGGLATREQQVSQQNERFVTSLQDLLRGFSVIKSFKAEDRVRASFNRDNHELETTKRARRFFEQVLNALANFSAEILQMGVFVFGAYLAIRGDITVGTVLIFVNLCNYLISPIQTVPQYLATRKAARTLVHKLAEITDENTEQAGAAVEPVLREGICFNHVAFGYDPEKPVLRDLTLTLRPGRRYALVGMSGSGKSTFLNLLMGAYRSYDGSITVDGQELRDVNGDSLYDLMSLIDQNVYLFQDTIRNNITMFGDFPAAQIDSAVERAGLAALLAEKGEDYRCGENGAGLSGGERQRISIARSLLRGTPVLLVDEATAALDAQTAHSVCAGILELDGATSLTVTHRLEEDLLRRYDEIFVLKDGALCERGNFETLMEEKGILYSLYTVASR